MTHTFATSGASGATRAAAEAARALATVGDDRARHNGQRHAVASEAYRNDVQGMEHVRQSRLKRWQTLPATSKRRAGN